MKRAFITKRRAKAGGRYYCRERHKMLDEDCLISADVSICLYAKSEEIEYVFKKLSNIFLNYYLKD